MDGAARVTPVRGSGTIDSDGVLAARPPTSRFTYGFGRASILAALANAVAILIGVGAVILEAVQRLSEPIAVPGATILGVALVGIAINTGTALLFRTSRHSDLNAEGAFLHMAADAAVSVAVVAAAAGILLTGWTWLDPAVAILVSLLIAWTAFGLLRSSLGLSFDGVPSSIGPAFRKEGTITAGNAPGLNTGAAAMIVAERGFVEASGLTPAARLVAYGVGAVEPGMFGVGPVPAVRQALDRAGWSIGDIERIEINEAFAAIALAVTRELGLAEDVVNVEGGAIAHGHPIGATGAILTTRLLHSMKRDGLKRGVVTLCIGGGQGIALAVETLD